MGEADDQRWTLHYDLDGRLKAFNDIKVVLGPGVIPQVFGQVTHFPKYVL